MYNNLRHNSFQNVGDRELQMILLLRCDSLDEDEFCDTGGSPADESTSRPTIIFEEVVTSP